MLVLKAVSGIIAALLGLVSWVAGTAAAIAAVLWAFTLFDVTLVTDMPHGLIIAWGLGVALFSQVVGILCFGFANE